MRSICDSRIKGMEEMKRNRVFRILTAAVLALGLLLSACGSNTDNSENKVEEKKELSETKKDISAQLTQFVQRMNLSGSVYLVHEGEEVLDIAQNVDGVSTQIPYGAASLTKQITASCIMKLYEADKLDINDTLDRYYPDYRFGDKLTLRTLLSQRSGVPDYEVESVEGRILVTCEGSEDNVEISADNTAEENRKIIRDFFMSKELLFEPGERFNYSDSNYALLAGITEQVSGMSFHDYARKNIFEPLGMKASFIDDNTLGDLSYLSPGDGTEFEGSYFSVKGAEFGCGDMLCSTGDLYSWYKGLTGGKVVSGDSYKLMTENYSDDGEIGYGFGLMIYGRDESKLFYHTGWIPSNYSSIYMIPDKEVFLAVLCSSGKGYPHDAATAILRKYCEYIGIEI